MAKPKINGRYFDWASIDISIDGFSKEITGDITEISYDEKTEMKHRYGLEIQPRGYSKGNREYTGKIVFNTEGFNAFIETIKSKGYKKVDELPPVSINIHFMNDNWERVITRHLKGVKFHSPKESMKSGDTELTVEMEMLIMDIEWAS